MDQRHTQRTRSMSVRQAQNNPDVFDEEYNDIWPSRTPTSTRRYTSDVRADAERTRGDTQLPSSRTGYVTASGNGGSRKNSIPPRRTATQTHLPVVQTPQPNPRRRPAESEDDIEPQRSGSLPDTRSGGGPRLHWLFYVGVSMLVMVIAWFAFTSLMSWWQVTQDDWHYGRPRTYQTDYVVGHNHDSSTNPSHFIAINLNRHIQIIEFPAGDSSKAKIYVGPVLIGQGQDLAPVTLTFKDVNGDGKVDMIVSVQASRFIFINENDAFRPARPGESIQSV